MQDKDEVGIADGAEPVGDENLGAGQRRQVAVAYLAEGNVCEAIRQFDAFRALLRAELGLQPTDALRQRLVTGAGAAPVGTAAERLGSTS